MNEAASKLLMPRRVNPRKLAFQGAELSGALRVGDLSMLADAVEGIEAVQADLKFYIGDDGRVLVEGEISCELSFQCQRCLQPVEPRRVLAQLNVAVVRTEDDAVALPRAIDPWLVPDDEGDLIALIEEELLLSLPVVSYHAEPCVDKSLYLIGDSVEEKPVEAVRPSPFSVLEALKHKDKQS